MAKVFFSIKLREKLAWRAICIKYVADLKDKLKSDFLINTSRYSLKIYKGVCYLNQVSYNRI